MRKRMIHPKIWESAFDKNWNSDTTIVFIAAFSNADDEGIGRISAIKKLVSHMIRADYFTRILSKLPNEVIPFDDIYYFIPKWKEYQTINRPTPTTFPRPNHPLFKGLDKNSSLSNHGTLPEQSLSNHGALTPNRIEDSLKEKNRIEGNSTLSLFSFFGINENDMNDSVIERADKLIKQYSFEKVKSVFIDVSSLPVAKRNIAYIEKILTNPGHKKTIPTTPTEQPAQYKNLTPIFEDFHK